MSLDIDRAREIVGKLEAAGLVAVIDPRSATPPCVLGTPPSGEYDLPCGFTAEWQWFALAPGTGNLDVWVALAAMRDAAAAVLPLRRFDFMQYNLSVDNPSLPAYRLQFEEAL